MILFHLKSQTKIWKFEKNKLGEGGANFIARPRAQSCLATPLSAISRLEKVIISKLWVVSDFDAKIVKGTRASIVWRYFGALQQSTADGKPSFWTTSVLSA